MEIVQSFWVEVVEVWTTGFLGQPIGRALTALGIFAFFFLARGPFARFLISGLTRLATKTETEIDDLIVKALYSPLKLAPIALGVYLAASYLGQADAQFVRNSVQSLITFLIFWSLYRLTTPAAHLLTRLERTFGETMVDWLARIVKAIFVFVGGAGILQIWGVPVLPFLASLSLLSVAVALGAQDLFKNLIAGALIIAERRFRRGDWVKAEGVVEGTVEQVGFRSTTIRRFDKAPVYVPNSKLSDDVVTNFTRMTHRRIYWMIGIEYRATVEQLRQIRDGIEAYVHESEEFANPSEVSTFVRIDKFNDSSIDVMLYCFTRTTVWGEWLEIKERLAYKIKEIVERAGAGFAFPSQSVYVEALPDSEKPEVFEPPKEKAAVSS
ncbi:MAG: mechanosensitive ion channel family protein [Pseudomonadota bacterium]